MAKPLETAVLLLTFAVFGYQYTGKYRRILLHNRTLGPPRDISCYNSGIKNDLPAADERKFPENSIFFLETSCKGGLDSRQACSIESAARAHPLWQVNVLFAGPVNTNCLETTSLSALRRYNNVFFYRIRISEIVRKRPLERMAEHFNVSSMPVFHAADVLRYLVLFKWSGVYLDLDMVVMKAFDGLARNWAGRTYGMNKRVMVGASVMKFSRNFVGRSIAAAAVRLIRDNINPSQRANVSADVITRVLQDYCSTTNVSKMNVATCDDFQVYNHMVFYPFSWSTAHALLSPGTLPRSQTHAVHAWASTTYRHPIPPDSLYSALAQLYCPVIYGNYKNSFGTNINNVL